ncbi:MAG: monooxygenase [Myxococcota bacterium]
MTHRGLIAFVVLAACSASDPSSAVQGTDDDTGAPTSETGPGESTGADDAQPGDSTGTVPASVTFHRDIRPLVERHCVTCHTPGNIAPFPLQTYDEVLALRESVAAQVSALTMPPWGMESDCADFEGDPSLSEAERELFSAWVDGGAPEGDPGEFVALDPIVLPELSRTDLTLELAEPYTPTLMPDEYRCFLMEWPESEVTFVTGLQFEPGNISMDHHAIAYIIAPEDVATYDELDAAEPGPGYTCFGGPSGGAALDFIASRWLGAWAPGARVGDLPEGTGLRIDPGSKIVLQMHYNTLAADGQPDQSRMHYRLDAEVEREAVMLPWADPGWIGGTMPIPAGTDDTVHTFALDPTEVIDLLSGAIPAGVPLEIFSSMHHMHRRGSRGVQSIERADGSSECLLSIPNYDYNWQHDFRRTQSVIVNPGDQLRLECQWDNADNAQTVNWGDGTDDEMCLGIHYLAVAQ